MPSPVNGDHFGSVYRYQEVSDRMRYKPLVVIGSCCAILFSQTPRRPAVLSQDSLALKNLNAINQAALIYYSWLKQVPTTLKQLGPTDRPIADRDAADLIPKSLAGGLVGGYKFTLQASRNGWVVTATPVEYNGQVQFVYKIESRMVVPK
jgi:hypothetical protein